MTANDHIFLSHKISILSLKDSFYIFTYSNYFVNIMKTFVILNAITINKNIGSNALHSTLWYNFFNF
ncbi:hypothetical protein EGY07_15970 [Chryseobacterium indologenes]|nr:hypothetical protein EGY07_15970 [Chryseobacterium indologenes]